MNGEVYDATAYLQDHPGGADSILLVAGDDATEDFMAIHSDDAKKKLVEVIFFLCICDCYLTKVLQYHIGKLSGPPASLSPSMPANPDPTGAFLNPKIWKTVTLASIDRVNHDSIVYRFMLPSQEQSPGLPIGQHVFVRLRRKDTGELVQRAYTPVSREDAKGSIDFLIKCVPTVAVHRGL